MLQVSKGFSYAWNPALPVSRRVVQDSVTIDGRPLELEASYRVTVNSFIAEGGDGLTVLQEGRERSAGVNSREALIRYIGQRSPLAPGRERRVRNISDRC